MRLIDADDLKEWSEIVPTTWDGGIDLNDFDEKLRSMPTVDAVPVVRCKDCKYSDDSRGAKSYVYCERNCCYFPHDGFCHKGRRAENETD